MLEISTRELENAPDPFELFFNPQDFFSDMGIFSDMELSDGRNFKAIWSKPDTTLVGFGCAASLDFQDLASLRALPENAILMGGNRFMPSSKTSHSFPDWRGFGDSRLVLPKYLFCYKTANKSERVTLLTATSSEGHPSLKASVGASGEASEGLSTAADHKNADLQGQSQGQSSLDKISDALAEIKAKTLQKVIFAICEEISLPISFDELLPALKSKFENCTIFAFQIETRQIFFGASPELLLQIKGQEVFTAALAGSAARSSDPKIDRQLQKKLRSKKERHEHRIVVEHIIEKLIEAGVEPAPDTLETIMAPRVLELPGIRHLSTPISGRLKNTHTHILEVLEALAPTPAVAGTPLPRALDFIGRAEAFDRGWYSGAVGWCTPQGEGEFYTALRSGLLSPPDKLSIFAGAGIVANSKPEAELAEINLKLEAIKDIFTKNNNLIAGTTK